MMKITLLVILGLLATTQALPRGVRRWPGRIVGGTPAPKNSLPYQISLQHIWYGHLCGGSILNENYIVTAAHCAEIGEASEFTVVAGEHDLYADDGTEQTRNVAEVKIYEGYVNIGHATNDIALMKLATPFTINGAVKALPLAPEGHDASGDAIVSGWGSLSSGGDSPDVLYQVSIPIVSDEVCRASYGESEIYDNMICAGKPEGGLDSCQGDSGGPFVANDLGYSYLAGIVSWGRGCALPGYPGVYTEVAYFAEWVAKNSAN